LAIKVMRGFAALGDFAIFGSPFFGRRSRVTRRLVLDRHHRRAVLVSPARTADVRVARAEPLWCQQSLPALYAEPEE
jgi:hypothetical protein